MIEDIELLNNITEKAKKKLSTKELKLLEKLKSRFIDLGSENFILKKIVSNQRNELERLQPDLYNKNTQAERDVFKYADLIHSQSLKTQKKRGKFKPTYSINLKEALWKASQLNHSKTLEEIIKNEKDGELFLDFYNAYLKWRSNKKKKPK